MPQLRAMVNRSIEKEFRNVEEPPRVGSVHMERRKDGGTLLRQEDLAELVTRRSYMPYRPKDWTEGTANEVVFKNVTLSPPHFGICVRDTSTGHQKSLVYETPVPSVEGLVFRISVDVGRIRDNPGVFQNGTNLGSRMAMEESKHNAERLDLLELYVDEHYRVETLSLKDHLGNVEGWGRRMSWT
ncbi:hypothetical protein TNCV_1300331 [Trichonephila clavipes]|nr:hypothetical protein TNCV_1300331 [Trichonephila clavipes]